MNIEELITEIFGGEAQPEASPLCAFAQQFQAYANTLYLSAQLDAQKPAPAGLIAVNQNKLLLLDKYFEYRNAVPKNHRQRVSTTGHTCIWHVFEDYYNKLKIIELRLIPPMLYIPEPQPEQPKQVREVRGLYIGEQDIE